MFELSVLRFHALKNEWVKLCPWWTTVKNDFHFYNTFCHFFVAHLKREQVRERKIEVWGGKGQEEVRERNVIYCIIQIHRLFRSFFFYIYLFCARIHWKRKSKRRERKKDRSTVINIFFLRVFLSSSSIKSFFTQQWNIFFLFFCYVYCWYLFGPQEKKNKWNEEFQRAIYCFFHRVSKGRKLWLRKNR